MWPARGTGGAGTPGVGWQEDGALEPDLALRRQELLPSASTPPVLWNRDAGSWVTSSDELLIVFQILCESLYLRGEGFLLVLF